MKDKIFRLKLWFGGVAQLARAPALQAGGQEFDSPHLHQYIEKYIDKEGKLAYEEYATIKPKELNRLYWKMKSEVKLQRA